MTDFNPGDLKQGDVNFIPVKKLPEGCKPIEGNVLAEGEVTGHYHALVELEALQARKPEVNGLRYYVSPEGERYVEIQRPLKITHQEHSDFVVDKRDCDIYKIEIDREWDYETKEERRVVD